MIDMNIHYFRKKANMTQQQLAKKLNVTRQTVAKWENGDATPNINECMGMAELWEISLDDLVKDFTESELKKVTPKGKRAFGFVTVGERGQIVIPKEARDVFSIKPGDKLFVLGDEEQGIAIITYDRFVLFSNSIL